MAQAGSIQTLSGPATARTPQGQVRELHVGDIVYENELIETSNGAQITIVLNNGDLIRLAQNSEILLDASVGGPIDQYDAIVHDVEALQNALLNNEDIIEEQDTAIGETESAYYYDDPYYSGDASKGQVGSYLLDAENDTAGQTFGPLIADDNDNEADVPPPAAGVPTVPPGNNAPVATNDTTTTDEDTAILNDFVPPATDVDGTIASYALVTDVAQGSLTFNPDGSYSFDPNGNFDDLSPGESRDVSFTYTAIDNNGATSAPATIDITITGTNDLPVVTGTVTGAVAEGDLGDTVTATGTIAISDVDADDAPVFADTTQAGTYGSLALVGGNWTYTLDQAAVQDLDAGDVVTDTITLTASDGTTQDIDITITGTNDGPVIDLDANDSSGSAGTAFETTFTEGSGGVSIADSDITISDVDSSSIESAVITITNVEADDLLIVGSLPAGITAGAYDSATGTITLTGSATLADYQQAIRAIQYDNVGDSIGAARTIEVTVNDGLNNSNTAISTVNITTLPTVSIDDVSVQEPDSGTTTMTFTVSIDQALGSDLTFDYQTVDVSTLAGADYVGIGTTTGTITAGNTSTTITVTVNSDTNVFEGDETFTLDLSNFNQTVNFPSGAHLTGGGIQGIGNIGADNGPPDAVDDAFITAPDTPLVTGDVLTNDILVDNAVYDSHDGTSTQGGTVTYNGDGTFTYTPAAGFTGTDTFTYTVIDDDGETDTATVTIDVSSATVNPPTVSAVPDTSYTENDAATSILAGTTLADVDSTSLSSVVVRIDGYIGSQDVLDYLTAGTSVNASVSISGSTWELTLTNGADIDEYESVLNSLTYENASDNPSASTRAITVEAYDETYNNLFSSDSGNLSVLPVNDAPEVFDNTTYVIANSLDNGLNITVPTDPDTDDSDLVITVTGLPGTIGTVTLADGTPVNIGDTLTQAELAALQFDAGGADGEEAFTYTVFDGDLTTTGTTTINVGSTDPDAGTVYESALPDGTGSDGGSATVTGNLFENDSAAGNSIDSVDFGATTYTPTAGVITVTTALGTLNVYADNTTPGFSAGDYVYELTTADGTGADVTESFTYNFTNGIPLSDTLTITVEDDEPIASDLVESVPESEEQVFNVVLTLDVSTSMNAAVGSTTRLELAKDALVSLSQEYFRQSSQVTVTVLLFANGAHELGTYTTFEDVQTAISGVTDVNTTAYPNDLGAGNLTNSTSYVDATALIENVLSADIAAQDPADDTRNISYFLSDGAVTADGTPVGNGFDDFVNSNAIYSYAVGIGTGLPGDLTDLNYIHNIDSMGEGYGTVDPALIVEDVSQLQSELLSTVPTAFGGNITVDVDGSVDNVLFGADTGYVDSITIDLGGTDYTFTYDGSLVAVPPALAATVEVDGTTITLDADDGFAFGTLTFDFSDGSYTFSAPNGTAPATVSFGFSIVDGDGDTASATATFNIVDDAPEARDDLHSITAGETAEGNVITAMGTDGGPAFGLDYTPFATQGGGVDKIVDNAVVTEFTYKGETISLDLTLTTTTVTPPDPTGISEDVAINSSTNWAATNVALSANAGFDADGAGIDGGRGDARIDDRDGGDALTMSFDTVDLPYGVDNLILTMADFQSNRSDAVMITLYDPSGAVIDTLVYAATNNTSVETIDLTAYTGIGSVDLARAGGQDSQLANVAFDPSPAVPYDVTSLDQTGGDNGGNLTWVYSYDYDLDGNPVFDATVTDSDDGSTFTMRSNGYYSYMPDPSSIPTPVTITESFTDGSADQGITVTSTANGNPVITYNGANGIGVNSNGDTWGDSADSGDNIILTFDPVLYPDGIEETTLSFGYDSGTGSAIFYDSTGAVIDTVALTGNNTQAFTGISGIYSIEITTGADGDYSISQIDFTVVPDPTTLPNTLDPILVDYTLTDTDGQSDTAQLAIYTIDNEITGTVGADSITGGALNDAITGDAGDDVLSGGDGNDSISGGAGEDTLSGNDGNDYLSGGDDADTVYGGAGQDHLDGDAGDDIVDGGTGDDIVLGGTGNDLVFGGAGDDRLEGEEGDDTLSGGSGNDTLVGGDGSDTLDGGAGADIVDGGRGADSIVFDENDTHIDGGTGLDTLLISNEVLDFSALSDGTIENIEKLDLNSADAQSISLSLDDVLDMTDANHVLEVTGGEGDEITFAGVQGPGADWTYNGGGLFTHINGIDQVQIVSTDDPDNHVQMFTDDGTPIES